jgi:hypothetical protein
MSKQFESSIPSDIRLLLRADAEQCWLHHEVIPVLREVETCDDPPTEELGAALAYLEAMWDEATMRAHETDAAYRQLHSCEQAPEALAGPAGRYHAAVRMLREIIADRVAPLVDQAFDFEKCQTGDGALRIKDTRPGGCAPRAV